MMKPEEAPTFDIHRMRRAQLRRCPELLQETTATYFASVAQMGMDYRELERACRFCEPSQEAKEALAYMQQRIEEYHLETFGTPLVAED
jgi:hypothetical protein